MFKGLLQTAGDAAVRYYGICLFLSGVAFAAIMPYQSLIALDALKIPGEVYSLVVLAAAVTSVAVAILIGALSDVARDRRPFVYVCAMLGAGGCLAIFLGATPLIFVLVHILVLPVAGTVFQQFFAIIRSYSMSLPPADRDMATSGARAFFSLSWIIVPPLVGLMLMGNADMIHVYLVGALAYFACWVVFHISARRIPTQHLVRQGTEPRIDLWRSLRVLRTGQVVWPVACISLLDGAQKLHGMFFGLLITRQVGGSLADVGIAASAIALLEIPLIIAWAALLRRIPKSLAVAAAGLIYTVYLVLLSGAGSILHVYLLIPVNAVGAAALLSVPIGYLQERVADRPGLGSSLLAVTGFLGWALAAAAFALAAGQTDYTLLALIGAGLAGAGAAAMFVWVHLTRRSAIDAASP